MTDYRAVPPIVIGLATGSGKELPARETLPFVLHKTLLRRAGALAPDLDVDLHEDIVQRMWELLLHPGAVHFDPHRGSAMAYIFYKLRIAARDIRAAYAPPGSRTRLHRNAEGRYVQ